MCLSELQPLLFRLLCGINYIGGKSFNAFLILSDTFEARRGLSVAPASRLGQQRDSAIDNYSLSASEPGSISSNKALYGTGLKNDVGEYNCFLNVIIQVSI